MRVAETAKNLRDLNTTTITSLQKSYEKTALKPSNGMVWRLLNVAAQNTLTSRT